MIWENYVIKLCCSQRNDAIHIGMGQLLPYNHEYFSLEKALQCQCSLSFSKFYYFYLSGCLCIVCVY